MSFTKIPNFSNCNIWLPQQQLNIVMKYYHTRVKSTSFLKFSSLFLVKCHLYNKHFFPTTQAILLLCSLLQHRDLFFQ